MEQARWSYLCGVPQDYEADIIIGLLDQQNIPAVKRYPGAGEFLKAAYGLTCGVDIYVPPEQLESGRSLIRDMSDETSSFRPQEPQLAENENSSEQGNEIEVHKKYQENEKTSSNWRVWGIVLFVILLVMAFITQKHLF